MSERFSVNRRTVVAGAGAAAVLGIGGGYVLTRGKWSTVETPVDVDLNDVGRVAGTAVAVGGGGTLLARTADGWQTRVQGGPGSDGRDLRSVDATDDGRRLWAVGDSGAIGAYDPASGSFTNYSSPNDTTHNFTSVAATGPAGDATVYAADQSGHVHYSRANGDAGTWESVTPGSGAGIAAIDFFAPEAGVAVDTAGAVWATDDGATWSRIGVEDSNVNFYGVDADGPEATTVVGGSATALRYTGEWARTDLGDAALQDVERDGGRGMAVGDGGVAFAYRDGAWNRAKVPTGTNLAAVSLGSPTVLVGDSGTVVEAA